MDSKTHIEEKKLFNNVDGAMSQVEKKNKQKKRKLKVYLSTDQSGSSSWYKILQNRFRLRTGLCKKEHQQLPRALNNKFYANIEN